MSDTRQAQIATWQKMRRAGQMRYVLARSLGSGGLAAVLFFAIGWFASGVLEFKLEALFAFAFFSIFDAARARADWKKFESIYPDVA